MATGRKFKVGDIVELKYWTFGNMPGTPFRVDFYAGGGEWSCTKLSNNSVGWMIKSRELHHCLLPTMVKKEYSDGLDNWE